MIEDLNFLIGPKLYEANWLDLVREKHIANVQCIEVWCPMTSEFFCEYLKLRQQNVAKSRLLYIMNPKKFEACAYLINYHEPRNDKILVFSDNIYALQVYSSKLGKQAIHGGTPENSRLKIFSDFKHNSNTKTIFISKVGDNSIDLPEANVIIQISSHFGSRRQEAQRLGRILRKKSGNIMRESDEFDAFFYSLVSRDTEEVFYSAKRQQFLVDQGYAFKVLCDIPPQSEEPSATTMKNKSDSLNDSCLMKRDEQLKLLTDVLATTEAEGEIEVSPEDVDLVLVSRDTVEGNLVERRDVSLSDLTGGDIFFYDEWDVRQS